MKRDARIGLAVVLVLGLAVTLLIGRALYRPHADVADAPHDEGVESALAAANDDDRRVNGADTTRVTPASAPLAPQADGLDARSENVILPSVPNHTPATGAVATFIDNNTRPIGTDRFAGAPAMTPSTVGGKVTPHPTAGGPTPEDADHEGPTPTPGNGAAVNHADGYGYTVAAGDNVWKISSKVYGDGKFTQKITEANKGVDLSKLKPGMVVHIPAIEHKTILLKLPAFADAKSGKPAPVNSVPEANKPALAENRVRAADTGAKPAATNTEASTHKVEAGETLGSIAKKYYGTNGPKTIAKIVEANKGLDPAKLKIGQELVMPAAAVAAKK